MPAAVAKVRAKPLRRVDARTRALLADIGSTYDEYRSGHYFDPKRRPGRVLKRANLTWPLMGRLRNWNAAKPVPDLDSIVRYLGAMGRRLKVVELK